MFGGFIIDTCSGILDGDFGRVFVSCSSIWMDLVSVADYNNILISFWHMRELHWNSQTYLLFLFE